MNIFHISFECYPIAKVGGLADVVGALPKYQNKMELATSVITPFYDNQFVKDSKQKTIYKSTIQLGEITYPYSIEKVQSPDIGFNAYLVYIKDILDRPNVYNYEDDAERCITFQLAVLDWITTLEKMPDIVHCHDHHTALIPFLMTHANPYTNLREISTILTIHNAQYQGQLSYDKLHYLPAFNREKIGLLDWDNCINPLASGIKCAWRVTTVSPSYMEELQENANGLEGLLRHERKKCIGILNGIDTHTWDPETDPMLISNFQRTNVVSGRKENKKWICNHFDLDIDKPLFGFIGRLVGEKGADLLPDIIKESLHTTDINIMILGSGNSETEEQLLVLQEKFAGRYNTYIGYDEKLSHIIYAGVDFLLMPSRVEPCGLNQMYALRYGAIPIVRRIGGLKDTVIDIGEEGFGICHDNASVQDVYYAIERAVVLYKDQEKYKEIQKQIMKIDHSWDRSAHQYIAIYESLIP
ncbi:starch synthase [Aquimarina sp. EL_43]|uniref:glycogen synthase n=1 Tax=unclassified Aquimarina TaxID=2627091 RepID=UPI0018CA6813|nr:MULTISPECIES: glycogen synthase [unclassified Aquimarina]MBG6129555.1 starch synthase [Aquimarina sp. EL_35]MBG6150620.1 starch synthase [Aquimarina sp. EL_32]MBG6168072.1 starch synthase [Aquimarina sp. EL_43]